MRHILIVQPAGSIHVNMRLIAFTRTTFLAEDNDQPGMPRWISWGHITTPIPKARYTGLVQARQCQPQPAEILCFHCESNLVLLRKEGDQYLCIAKYRVCADLMHLLEGGPGRMKMIHGLVSSLVQSSYNHGAARHTKILLEVVVLGRGLICGTEALKHSAPRGQSFRAQQRQQHIYLLAGEREVTHISQLNRVSSPMIRSLRKSKHKNPTEAS